MENNNKKVVWKDVHEQNAIFVELLISTNNLLIASRATANKIETATIERLSTTTLKICEKHKQINIASIPEKDVLVTQEQYMNYFNTFGAVTECIDDMQIIITELEGALL